MSSTASPGPADASLRRAKTYNGTERYEFAANRPRSFRASAPPPPGLHRSTCGLDHRLWRLSVEEWASKRQGRPAARTLSAGISRAPPAPPHRRSGRKRRAKVGAHRTRSQGRPKGGARREQEQPSKSRLVTVVRARQAAGDQGVADGRREDQQAQGGRRGVAAPKEHPRRGPARIRVGGHHRLAPKPPRNPHGVPGQALRGEMRSPIHTTPGAGPMAPVEQVRAAVARRAPSGGRRARSLHGAGAPRALRAGGEAPRRRPSHRPVKRSRPARGRRAAREAAPSAAGFRPAGRNGAAP